jgi:hypothetical protein
MDLHGDNYRFMEHKDDKMARMRNQMTWRPQYYNMPRLWSDILYTNYVPGGIVINLNECSCQGWCINEISQQSRVMYT